MDIQDLINHWQLDAEDSLDTAIKLHQAKKYHHALFFGHLSLEKAFKAKVIQHTQNHPPKIHDLIRLASKANIPLTNTQIEQLLEINDFNLRARYQSYKRKFYKRATKEYSEKWLQIIKNFIIWIKSK